MVIGKRSLVGRIRSQEYEVNWEGIFMVFHIGNLCLINSEWLNELYSVCYFRDSVLHVIRSFILSLP